MQPYVPMTLDCLLAPPITGGGAGVGDKLSVTSFQRRAITDGSELTANPDYTFVVRHFAAVHYDPQL